MMMLRPAALAAALALALVACGGSKEESPAADVPASRADAARFLTQATFGPTSASIDRVMALGYSAWIDEQFALPASSNRDFWDVQDVAAKAADPTNANATIGADGVYNAFWRHAVSANDQLRQRTAFALSQIMVISLQDSAVANQPRAVANYLDLLGSKGFGNYRELIEAVSLNPMMGTYLSSIRNRKADAATGRVPDENYAREVMQLFSIGLEELNADGSAKLVGGVPQPTYGPSDVAGLAKVFTGWSWACPNYPANACFTSGAVAGVSDPERWTKSMVGYPNYHASEEKSFLGVTIPAQGTAAPEASLKTGLDTLSSHPNVGPFIGRQLIQRLVTSNPSPSYVAAVAGAFADNGAGVRGDMKAVLKAVLLHPEARAAATDRSGKIREPILRLSALLRAFGYASDSGRYRVGNTDNAGTSLGQTAMRSPSVFNFYRPGYVPPGTQAAAAGLVAPELALAQETSAAGYANYMRDGIASGFGASATVTVNGAQVTRRDLQPDFSAELALADKPDELVQQIADKLMPDGMPDALKTEIVTAVGAVTIPVLNSAGSNQTAIDNARRTRVNAAVFLTMVSPEFQVQK